MCNLTIVIKIELNWIQHVMDLDLDMDNEESLCFKVVILVHAMQ